MSLNVSSTQTEERLIQERKERLAGDAVARLDSSFVRNHVPAGFTLTIPSGYTSIVDSPFSIRSGGSLVIEDGAKLKVLGT